MKKFLIEGLHTQMNNSIKYKHYQTMKKFLIEGLHTQMVNSIKCTQKVCA